MSLFKFLRTPIFYLRKEAITTGLVNYNEEKSQDIAEEKPSEEKPRDPKDRSQIIPVKTSIRYLKSEAYKTAYGDLPVWTHYRRNFKGQFPPETRRSCIKRDRITTGSPCPICRDEYLVVDYTNVDLLKQFISPHGGQILTTMKTGVCQRQYQNLLVAIQKARNYGFLTSPVPHRAYNYSIYNKK